jgi:hypothetical protein
MPTHGFDRSEEQAVTKRGAAEIYEEQLRDLPRAERLRLLALLADDLADDETGEDAAGEPAVDVMALHGLGKELWAGIDTQEYVNALREGREYPGERRPPDA